MRLNLNIEKKRIFVRVLCCLLIFAQRTDWNNATYMELYPLQLNTVELSLLFSSLSFPFNSLLSILFLSVSFFPLSDFIGLAFFRLNLVLHLLFIHCPHCIAFGFLWIRSLLFHSNIKYLIWVIFFLAKDMQTKWSWSIGHEYCSKQGNRTAIIFTFAVSAMVLMPPKIDIKSYLAL